MENVYKILYISAAMVVFALVIGIFYNTNKSTEHGLQELTNEVSEVYIEANKTIQQNFERVITGSELKYALSHNKDKLFYIGDVKVDETNYQTIYNAIKDKSTYDAVWDDEGAWKFTLKKEAHSIVGLPETPEVIIVDEDVNSNAPWNEFEKMEVGTCVSYTDLLSRMRGHRGDLSVLISGAFGNVACSGQDLTAAHELLQLFGLSEDLEVFKVINSSIQDLAQISLELETRFFNEEQVLDLYRGKLVFGNNLARVLSASLSVDCVLVEDETSIPINAPDIKRSSAYCVFEEDDVYKVKNSGVIPGIALQGHYWKQWQEGCNNAWEYNMALHDETVYSMESYEYNSIGIITMINVKEEG